MAQHIPLRRTYAESALSYAVERLSAVRTIAICGHSGCDAMHDLMHGEARGSVGRWLDHGADQPSVVNVATQVRAVEAHPLVAERVADGTVTVVGRRARSKVCAESLTGESRGAPCPARIPSSSSPP